jgi:hypothetical protein
MAFTFVMHLSTETGVPLLVLVPAYMVMLTIGSTILRLNDLLKPEQDRPDRAQLLQAMRTGVLVTVGLALAITATAGIAVLVRKR